MRREAERRGPDGQKRTSKCSVLGAQGQGGTTPSTEGAQASRHAGVGEGMLTERFGMGRNSGVGSASYDASSSTYRSRPPLKLGAPMTIGEGRLFLKVKVGFVESIAAGALRDICRSFFRIS